MKAESPNENIFKGKIDDYLLGKELGKGAYASVKQAIHRPTGISYAVKIYDKHKMLDKERKSAMNREIIILKQLDHPNIVKLHEVIDTQKHVSFL